MSLGQSRVKTEFNPAKNDTVDQIKNKAAELIDLLEELRNEKKETSTKGIHEIIPFSGERQRQISIAQTKVEMACMYGIKAGFTN